MGRRPRSALEVAHSAVPATRAQGFLIEEILFADVCDGVVSGVVKDDAGYLWLCRVERLLRVGMPESGRYYPTLLMPIYGPFNDPIDELPEGYTPSITNMFRPFLKSKKVRGAA